MMTYITGTKNSNGTVSVDGYSSAKSIKAALADMGRYIARIYDEAEGNALKEMSEDALVGLVNEARTWYCEVEEVGCATRYNENTDEIEYKDGYNYYVFVRFVV